MARCSAVVFFSSLVLVFSGCSLSGASQAGQAVKLSEVSGAFAQAEVLEHRVPRATYREVLFGRGALNKARLVQVFGTSTGSSGQIPEYRLFDVRKGSIYQLFGLRNGEVVVAANEYIIQEPKQFFGYLNIVHTFPEAYVLVRREGKPVKLKITFTEEPTAADTTTPQG